MVESNQETPKVFISYSWTSPEHVSRIIEWAERLVRDGVDVILDKWALKEGHDKYAFMEQMVTDPSVSKVVIFSDSVYARKADERKGGVGTESQIISAEIYNKVTQDKFIPIVLEYNTEGKPCLPVFLAPRIFIDFSSLERYYENYEQLLRIIFNKPLFKKPQIGTPPKFITEETRVSFPTTPKLELFKIALVNDKPSYRGYALDYLESVIQFLDEYNTTQKQEDIELDEHIITSISNILPIRNQVIDFFIHHVKYKNDTDIYEAIFSFFEQSLKFNTSTSDHLRFLFNELFVYLIAILIKYNRFSEIQQTLDRQFLKPANINHGRAELTDFRAFYAQMRTLLHRNERLKLGRLSIKADLLKQRATIKEITFDQYMQADFILMLFSILNRKDYNAWYPSSLVYIGYTETFEVFIRAVSHSYFVKLAEFLKVNDKQDFQNRYIEGAKYYHIERWHDLVWHADVSFERLMNLNLLDTQP